MIIFNWVICIIGFNLYYDVYIIDRFGCWMWVIGLVLEEVKVFVVVSVG